MEKANQWKHKSEGNIFNNTSTSMTICKDKYHRSYLHREVHDQGKHRLTTCWAKT